MRQAAISERRMATRGRRKSVGAVETARDLGVSTATISRALNGSRPVGFVIPYMDTLAHSAVAAECASLLSAAGPRFVPAELRVAGSAGPPPGTAVTRSRASLPAPSYRSRPRSPL